MTTPHKQRQPLSKLVSLVDRASLGVETGSPLILALHDRQQGVRDAVAFAAPLRDLARIVGVEAPKGVWYGKQIVGYTWYVGDHDRPAPYSFGVSLGELESFLLDTLDRRSEGDSTLPFLLGIGQGGAMALSTAALQPDRLSGVIAIDAQFPDVPGWDPPLAPLDGLPILLLDQKPAPVDVTRALHGEAIVRRFSEWGATVDRQIVTPETEAHPTIVKWLEKHLHRVDTPSGKE
jgi:pimeloyl-ACP methyl ester carboxylesterase